MSNVKLFVAGKAFIIREGKVLMVKEAQKYSDGTHEGEYDVVGGRLEPGEYFKDALLREIKEETGLEVQLGSPFFVNEWRPEVRGEKWQIIGVFFEARAGSSKVSLSDDHSEYLWIDPFEYKKYPTIDNLHPVFEEYTKRTRQLD